MAKITELNERSIAVEVPEGAKDFEIHNFISDKRPKLLQFKPNGYKFTPRESIELPVGKWSILGRPEEITEEQWKGIVETYPDDGCGGFAYMDYTACINGFETAKESGLDLLKSKGLNPSEVIILIKPQS